MPGLAAVAGKKVVVISAAEVDGGRATDAAEPGDVYGIKSLESVGAFPVHATIDAPEDAAVASHPDGTADVLVQLCVEVVGIAHAGRGLQGDFEIGGGDEPVGIRMHGNEVIVSAILVGNRGVLAAQAVPRIEPCRRSLRYVHVTHVGEEDQESGAYRFGDDIDTSTGSVTPAAVDVWAGQLLPLRCAGVGELAEIAVPEAAFARQALARGVGLGTVRRNASIVVIGRAEGATYRCKINTCRIAGFDGKNLGSACVGSSRCRHVAEGSDWIRASTTPLKCRQTGPCSIDHRNAMVERPRIAPVIGKEDVRVRVFRWKRNVATGVHLPDVGTLGRRDGEVPNIFAIGNEDSVPRFTRIGADADAVKAERSIHEVGIVGSKEHLAYTQAWSSIDLQSQLPGMAAVGRAVNAVAVGRELTVARGGKHQIGVNRGRCEIEDMRCVDSAEDARTSCIGERTY